MGLKAILEFLPLLIFLITYKMLNLKIAIIMLMISSVASLIILKLKNIQITHLMLATYAIMLIFGGLTLYTDDIYFIKIKPTIINLIFGTILLIDRFMFKRVRIISKIIPIFKSLEMSKLNKLTLIWGLYFLFCALLNEIVWRNFSEQTWVYFKVFGFALINILFSILNIIVLRNFLGKNLNVENLTFKE